MKTVALLLVTQFVALSTCVQVARLVGLEPSARVRAVLARDAGWWTRLLVILPIQAAYVYVVGRAWGWWA